MVTTEYVWWYLWKFVKFREGRDWQYLAKNTIMPYSVSITLFQHFLITK